MTVEALMSLLSKFHFLSIAGHFILGTIQGLELLTLLLNMKMSVFI